MIRETIIRKIVDFDLARQSLLEDNVRTTDDLLHAAAVNEFGSWLSSQSALASKLPTF